MKALGYITLSVGVCAYLYSVYHRVMLGFTQGFKVMVVFSLFVVMLGVLLLVIVRVRERRATMRAGDIRLGYLFVAAGFSTILFLGLVIASVVPETVALAVSSGMFVLVAPFVLVMSVRKIIEQRRNNAGMTERMHPGYYYLGLIAIVVSIVIFGVNMFW